jgi:glycosyltransferase involved in cell wall biosynthesis
MARLPNALKPDRVLAQSASLRDRFEAAGYTTEFMPSGVDLAKFHTVTADEKATLRRELDLPTDERLFLHVGHFKKGRDVFDLLSLRKFGEVIVIGSPSTGPEADVVDRLRDEGCHVRTHYIERIEQYYQAADVYVFPTRSTVDSIQAPLSVFEAMACGCPVVATDFGGLKDCFAPGDGLNFVENVAAIDTADLTFDSPNPREKVRPYSWDRIAERTVEHYTQL